MRIRAPGVGALISSGVYAPTDSRRGDSVNRVDRGFLSQGIWWTRLASECVLWKVFSRDTHYMVMYQVPREKTSYRPDNQWRGRFAGRNLINDRRAGNRRGVRAIGDAGRFHGPSVETRGVPSGPLVRCYRSPGRGALWARSAALGYRSGLRSVSPHWARAFVSV